MPIRGHEFDMNDANTHPYFAPTGLFGRWQLREGTQACMRIDIPGAALQLNKPAPGLPEGVKPAASPAPASPPKSNPSFKMLLDVKAAVDYLTMPAPAKPQVATKAASPPPAATASVKQTKPVFAFDIQDIPAAMDHMGWRKSAELMRQFFAGGLNFSRTKEDERDGIDQDGHLYAKEFVETKRFPWKWLLEYPAVGNALAQLVKPGYIDSRQGVKGAWATQGRKSH